MSTPKRRKAPVPPKHFSIKSVLYDFQAADDSELSLLEGDVLAVEDESAELTRDGWCKARLRGTNCVGLVPVGYLEPAESPHRSRG